MRARPHRAAPTPIRVVIVEDDLTYARGLQAMLQDSLEMTVIGVAHSGVGALRIVEQAEPDVVIIEYRLPDGTGAEVLRRLRRIRPVAGVFLSGEDSADALAAAVWEAGRSAYILKSDPPERVVAEVRKAASGAPAGARGDRRRVAQVAARTPGSCRRAPGGRRRP